MTFLAKQKKIKKDTKVKQKQVQYEQRGIQGR